MADYTREGSPDVYSHGEAAEKERVSPWENYEYAGYTGTSNAGNQYINDFVNKCVDEAKTCACTSPSWLMNERIRDKCIAAWEKAGLECYNGLICPIITDAQANANCSAATEQSMINDAIAARQAGINAGMGKARSGLLGDVSSTTNATSVGNNAYSSSIQNQGSTQADYLAKMGQACALRNCASNISRGALLNAIGAGFTGAAAGASLGASISGGSK